MSQKIVYASYGSNMSTDRFMAYIAGGAISGSDRTYIGCRDKTPPSKKLVFSSDSHVGYFSRNSSVWGSAPYNLEGSLDYGGLGLLGIKPGVEEPKGLRVLDPSKDSLQEVTENSEVLIAGYVITRKQFEDVVAQENKGLVVGEVGIPDELFDSLTAENPLIDLRNRTGDNAIVLPNGDTVEIDIKGAYSALMFLGEVEVEGEKIKAVTFSSPFDYRRAAAQTYVNSMISTIGQPGVQQSALEAGLAAVERIMPNAPTDKLHRLNPATTNYIEMIVSGVTELGEGKGDWSRDNAIEYALSMPPFHKHQIPEFAQMVRESLGLEQPASQSLEIE